MCTASTAHLHAERLSVLPTARPWRRVSSTHTSMAGVCPRKPLPTQFRTRALPGAVVTVAQTSKFWHRPPRNAQGPRVTYPARVMTFRVESLNSQAERPSALPTAWPRRGVRSTDTVVEYTESVNWRHLQPALSRLLRVQAGALAVPTPLTPELSYLRNKITSALLLFWEIHIYSIKIISNIF